MRIEAALYDGTLVGEPDGIGGVVPETCPEWWPEILPAEKVYSSVVLGHVVPVIQAGQVCHVGGRLFVGTLEGALVVSPGDWIIRGIKGEIYPCKPDIFETTYHLVMNPKQRYVTDLFVPANGEGENPVCAECGGSGYVTTSSSGEFTGSVGQKPCPQGCPTPVLS